MATNCDSLTNEEEKKLCESLQKLPDTAANDTYAQKIFTEAYRVAGLVAAIIIIVGAIQYITSSGDAAKAAKAKKTMAYAAIGLVVVVLAAVITNWVIGIVSGAK